MLSVRLPSRITRVSELPFEHRCPECYKQICFRVPARSRVFDAAGRLLADSQKLPGRVPPVITKPLASIFPDIFFQKFINDFFPQFFNSPIQVRGPIIEPHKIRLAHTFPEVISALQGSSIKTVKLRETGESLLTVAVPIQKTSGSLVFCSFHER